MAGPKREPLLRRLAAWVRKAVVPTTDGLTATGVSAFGGSGRRWANLMGDVFTGSWQSNFKPDPTESILANSAVYACITLIAGDISKLRPKLMSFSVKNNIWSETQSPAFSPVLRKPNHYQTRIQFLSQWVCSKLIHGNTYVLLERDQRRVVVAMYVLNPLMVKPLVTPGGEVYYQISADPISNMLNGAIVPASEIIHDRAECFFHPLVGVGPIYAAAMSATQGNKIQANSAKFFENMSRPSGQLTAPGEISDEAATRLKREFESNFSGMNLGRLLVTGDGLKYEPMTIPAQQSQLVEQLGWTVADVARAFHCPLHKVGGDSQVKFNNMAALDLEYYKQTLQVLIENIEVLLDEGLGLAGGPNVGNQVLGVELDLDGLLRMDPVQRAERNRSNVLAGVWSPNEARATDNLPPVIGGDEPYLQQQHFPLSVLVQQPPPGTAHSPAAPPAATTPPPSPATGDKGAIGYERDLRTLQFAVQTMAERIGTTTPGFGEFIAKLLAGSSPDPQ